MSLTLGEKLKQARETRGISLSEVAEQTRISRQYLESIDNDDYRILPGGIFNKGFVKSYAKYVGIAEQDALRDYAQLMSDQGEKDFEENKTYRPEVLTDDRNSPSMIPTLIFAVIILGLLTWGAITLVNYLRENQNQPGVTNNPANNGKTANSNPDSNSNGAVSSPQTMPVSNEIKVEFKALTEKINVEVTVDGKKSAKDIFPDNPTTYIAQQSVRLRYYKTFTSDKIQLTVNGKVVTVPAAPLNPKMQGIEFEINKENVAQIWQSGAVVFAAPPAPNSNSNVAKNAPR